MILMVVGLVLFFTIHLVPANAELRRGVVTRYGENAYKIGFSIISLVGLVLIVLGYHKLQLMPGKNPDLWSPPTAMRHIAFLLMLPAMILLVAAYVPSRIRTAAKHPMLAAVKIWALAHLLANGDMASIVLFGSFLIWAVYDRISLKHRVALGPLGAKTGGLAGDLIVLGVGTGLYLLMLKWGHSLLIGMPLLP
ncbi:MAG: NnrU family protein [Hyphomicrobiaceae bacterium]|nr:NnrU family protein [Hyphomicrobiaceae bacterium]